MIMLNLMLIKGSFGNPAVPEDWPWHLGPPSLGSPSPAPSAEPGFHGNTF